MGWSISRLVRTELRRPAKTHYLMRGRLVSIGLEMEMVSTSPKPKPQVLLQVSLR